MKILFFCIAAFALSVITYAQDTLNPLKGDIRVHDPVMIKEGNTYYVFSPGNFPSWHKTDIPTQDGNLWAPDIHYSNGKYYLYYSVSAWMNFNFKPLSFGEGLGVR